MSQINALASAQPLSCESRAITAGTPPGAAQPLEQPTPEPEPGPASEQSVERVEGDIAELSAGPPLHAAKADTPDRHHRLAQSRSAQRRLGPWSLWPGTVAGHRREFRQHRIDKDVDIGKCVPGTRRCLGGTDGSAHSVWPRCS